MIDTTKQAVIEGPHRYWLTRRWGEGRSLGWVMLNPSTADAAIDDPTIRRCMGFAHSWGFEAIAVVNVFSWRATKPADVRANLADAVGHRNWHFLRKVADTCPTVVAAWGGHGALDKWGGDAALEADQTLARRGANLVCLGMTQGGAPKHPLYVKGDTVARPYVTGAIG